MLKKHDRGIFRQLTEEMEKSEKLESENKKLKTEVKSLKAEVQHLRKENEVFKRELAELRTNMSDIITQAIDVAVEKATAPLKAELKVAYKEIDRLKAIINKDSSNSSKPPSSNGYKTIMNNREKSGRKQGGQKGHVGHRLTLPENLEEMEREGVLKRHVIDHTAGTTPYVIRYTLDLQVKVILTEHRFEKGKIPKELYNEVSYGDTIKGLGLALMNEGIIAKKRLTEIISGLSGGTINLSTGTLESFQNEFREKLIQQKEIEAIETDLLNGSFMHTDDTPARAVERPLQQDGVLLYETVNEQEVLKMEKAQGKSLSATVRTYANVSSTRYTVNPSKHQEGIERDGILPAYCGILSHDDESKFYHYGQDNATCHAHLSRELKGLAELYKCPWASEARVLFQKMNEHKKMDIENDIFFCDPQILASFEESFNHLLTTGAELVESMNAEDFGFTEINRMVNRLRKRADNYLLFIRNYTAPFTNNRAEQALRPVKTKQKISGVFRSWNGISTHVDVHSFLATLKKRKKNIVLSITQVFKGEPVLAN